MRWKRRRLRSPALQELGSYTGTGRKGEAVTDASWRGRHGEGKEGRGQRGGGGASGGERRGAHSTGSHHLTSLGEAAASSPRLAGTADATQPAQRARACPIGARLWAIFSCRRSAVPSGGEGCVSSNPILN